MDDKKQKDIVKKAYGKIASSQKPLSCCSTGLDTQAVAKKIGYSEDDLKAVPEAANLGLGCGNPTALAGLQLGQTVLDLGSGAGFDCFLAALKVGESGKVIGVDMTPEMIAKATENAESGGYKNVEFRLGELEHLPVEDNSIDVAISNCVINLVPDKSKVFQEVYRALKPDGKMCISDIVLKGELPESIKNSDNAYIGCISGAVQLEEYLAVIKKAGFASTNIVSELSASCLFEDTPDPLAKEILQEFDAQEFEKAKDTIISVKIEAYKE